jgi:hypothetical protein
MKVPRYKLDFEMDTYYDIKEGIEVKLSKDSKITLHPSKATNQGSIIFEKDTLDESQAKSEGKTKINNFIDFFILSSNLDWIPPLRFGKIELLNPEHFTGQTKIVYQNFVIRGNVVRSIDRREVKTTEDLIQRMNCLAGNEKKSLSRSVSWLRRAAEADNEEKFMYRWISLEALCGILPEISSTQKMLNILVHKYLKIDSAKDIFHRNKNTIDELVKAKLVGWKGRKPSEKLKETIQQNADCKAIMSKAALCVFEVRNSLFHKGEVLSLLGGCSLLLRDLVNKIIIDILLN